MENPDPSPAPRLEFPVMTDLTRDAGRSSQWTETCGEHGAYSGGYRSRNGPQLRALPKRNLASTALELLDVTQTRAFRIGEAAELLGVSPDTVRRWIDAGRLPARRPEGENGGQRTIAGPDLAAFAATFADTEMRERYGALSSARNRMRGIVTRVVRDGVMAQVEIQAGPHKIVSLMSREAADELGLEPGVLSVAVIKSTNVVVERIDP